MNKKGNAGVYVLVGLAFIIGIVYVMQDSVPFPSLPPSPPPPVNVVLPVWYLCPEGYGFNDVNVYPSVAEKNSIILSVCSPSGSQYAETQVLLRIRGMNEMSFIPNQWEPSQIQSGRYLVPIIITGYGNFYASYNTVTGDLTVDIPVEAIQNRDTEVSGSITFNRK